MTSLFDKACKEVLVCPHCKVDLVYSKNTSLCQKCLRKYPTLEQIPTFVDMGSKDQERERKFRNSLDYDYRLKSEKEIFKELARHHCIPVMRRTAKNFLRRFESSQWILDIGIGFGWHWKNITENHCKILGIDFSITNLKVAQRLLARSDNVLLICADTSELPIRQKCIDGIWSVQVFQHFPDSVYKKVITEVDSVWKGKFVMEIVNLNPATFHKFVCKIFGKHFHIHGQLGEVTLNRLSENELKQVWKDFREY